MSCVQINRVRSCLSRLSVATGCRARICAPAAKIRTSASPNDRDQHPYSGYTSGMSLTGLVFTRNIFYGKKAPKMPPTKPLHFDYGGDLEKSLPELDPDSPRLGYEDVEELSDGDDTLKKLFSLEFAVGRQIREKHIQDLITKVQEHPADTCSLEVRVATLTVMIRNQIKHCLEFRKDKVGKHQLVHRIQARHKALRKLRNANYERFQWICDELMLKYIPPNERNIPKLSKREKRIKIAKDQSEAIREEKMRHFRERLEKEKEEFMREKEIELAKIEEELKELGIDKTSSLAQTAEALKMGHILIDEKPKKSRRRQILEMKFELYKDRRYKNVPEHLKEMFKERDEQKKRVTAFYRALDEKRRMEKKKLLNEFYESQQKEETKVSP